MYTWGGLIVITVNTQCPSIPSDKQEQHLNESLHFQTEIHRTL